MMTTRYNMVFGMNVTHTYFQEGICTCLGFEPTAATAALMSRYGFKIRKQDYGFDLYSSSAQPLDILLPYITSATGERTFEFDMNISDELFYSYTNFPVALQGQMVFDTANISGGVLKMDLRSKANGAAGLLTVNFDDIVTGVPVFKISFESRSTQWQYYVVNRSAMPLNNPGISGKPGITFEGPQQVVIATGEDALLFSSGGTLLPLTNWPQYKFDLVNYATSSGNAAAVKQGARTVFRGLPVPNPAYFNISQVNGSSQVSSPIYVYI